MPGKQDPEYYPLNLNVYDFATGSIVHHLHPSKFETLAVEDEDDEMAAAVSEVIRSRSGSNTTRRTRNVSLNMTQNSDDEEETGSIQSGSDNEEDMVDTLVLSIREKLRMDPNFTSTLWTPSDSSPPNTPYNVGGDNGGCHSSHSALRRRRPHPYASNKARHGLATIQKKTTGAKSQWCAARDFRRGRSNPDSPRANDPYHLLQELIDSGSLIKEAVRRLSGPKRLGCVNANTSTGGSVAVPVPQLHCSTSTGSTGAQLLGLSPPTSRFTAYREDRENTYPMSAQ